MKEKISIIIPVYNVESYIDRCLESVVNQDYKNLEIILINDGSDDNSGEICDKWGQMDKRILVIHQKNKGVSAARNVGLDMAQGEYVGFVDPDDVISKDMFSSMIKDIKKTNADIVACGVSEIFLDGSERIYRKYDSPIKLNKKQAIEKGLMLSDDIGGVVWDKLWRRDIIKNIKFDESLAIAEDRLFVITALLNSKIFYRNFTPKYFCIKREKSATQSKFSEKNFHIVWSAKKVHQEVINKDKEYLKLANFHVVISCMNIISSMFLSNKKKEYELLYKEVIGLLNEISIKDLPREVELSFKIKLFILKKLPNLYMKLWIMRRL